MRNTVTSLLQRSGHTCRIRVQAFSNSAQPLGAVIHGVSTGNNRQQGLGGTDITGGLLTADVLLAGLQCQPVRRFTRRVLRNTHQTARQGTFHTLMNRHVRGVRAAEEERQTKALGVAHRNIGAQLTRGLQQGQSQQVGDHGHQSLTFFSGLNKRLNIAQLAILGGVREDHTVQVALGQPIREVGDYKRDVEHLRTTTHHRNHLRQAA